MQHERSKGMTIWFTGLSGAGKSTIAHLVENILQRRQLPVELLDGDEVRTHLSKGLGFSKADRDTNIRRIGWVAQLLNRHGVHAITAAISPYRDVRDEMRRSGPAFMEVFCDAPLDVLAARDVKNLYKRAMAGEIHNFTGVNDPYEPPLHPEVRLHTQRGTPEAYAARVVRTAELLGHLKPGPLEVGVNDAELRDYLASIGKRL